MSKVKKLRITKLGGQRYALWDYDGNYYASGSYAFVKELRKKEFPEWQEEE